MKFVDEFRRGAGIQGLRDEIWRRAGERSMTFMEVCGTHTMAIARNGIRQFLPETISLISGPGCPVCVTPNPTIDQAIALSRLSDVTLATFGDMMKVPGSTSSLDREHARGSDIHVVVSTLEALRIAEKRPDRKIVFLGIGFETTTPTIAAAVKEAQERRLNNFSVLSAHKVIPPAMRALSSGELRIDGFLCPGHVSAIIGSMPYAFLAEEYGIGCVISGFEPLDILQSISMLIRQVQETEAKVEIQYSRVVKPEGNPQALKVLDEVFESCDSEWRGIGMIPSSGLKLRDAYAAWDAGVRIPVDVEPPREPKGCLCGRVLQGLSIPSECRHFGSACTPDNPVGPCMVSSEGTCAAYFKYSVPA